MDRPAEKTSFNSICNVLPKVWFVAQVIIGIWLSFWILFNHQPTTGDDVEHMHSAWLVYQGKVPYLDFFQHHNPLLWYIFAPLAGMFAYDIALFDVVRIISTLVMFSTLFFSALIVKRFVCGSKYSGLLVVASVFPSYVIFSGQDFRPDNYMVLSFVVGLYCFFAYLEHKRLRDLIVSFCAMCVSFLFMQKIIFTIVFWGSSVIYLLYTKDIALKDFLKALILPAILGMLFLGWLLYHGMFERYWLSNYIFNLYIPDVYGGLVEATKPEFYVLTAIAFMGSVYFILRGNVYAKILCLLWLSEAIQRFFYFSLDRHYYYLLAVFSAMIAGSFAWVVINKWGWTSCLFAILSIWGCLVFKDYVVSRRLAPNYHRYVTPKYVLEQTNRCDSVLNGFGLSYGIFSKDITYYWNLNGQLDVIGNKIGLAPLPNLNAAVYEHLPQIIYTGPYWNEKLRKQKIDVVVHMIDKNLRDKYYVQSAFVNIFILKPEYQNKRRCRYNATTDSWEYFYKENIR